MLICIIAKVLTKINEKESQRSILLHALLLVIVSVYAPRRLFSSSSPPLLYATENGEYKRNGTIGKYGTPYNMKALESVISESQVS